MMQDESTKAANGAALLDEIIPQWYESIDIDTFNIDDSCFCTLGQLWGIYPSGLQNLETLAGHDIPEKEDGFTADVDFVAADNLLEFNRHVHRLNEAWLHEINRRKA